MVRGKRRASESDIYHVVSRGCGRQVLFEDDTDRRKYLALLKDNLAESSADLYAWCLMGNHVHLLMRCNLEDLFELMRRLNSVYSMHFNKRHNRVGHLMQGRFKSEPVDSDDYLLTVLRYIRQNPEKAKMAAAGDYPWSSFREHADGEPAYRICDTTFVADLFAGRDDFLRFHHEDDASAPCIDENRARLRLSDDDASAAVNAALDGCRIEDVAALPKDARERPSAACGPPTSQ